MDTVLEVVDTYALDWAWAKLFPGAPVPACTLAGLADAASSTCPGFSSIANATLSSAKSFPYIDWDNLHSPWEHASIFARDNIVRQFASLTLVTYVGIHFLYFVCAAASYYLVFDHDMMKHPRFLKNQVRLEIECSLRAFMPLTLMTVPWFIGDVRGYSRLYEHVDDYGWGYFCFSIVWFIVFTDFCIYWVHRLEHRPEVYKWLHKPHHKWLIPTPFASHAFHPLDGYLQSVPYHLFIYLFPLHKYLYLGLFGFVNLWSILIHDSDMICGHPLETIVNGPSHHTLHHLYFTCNYGQYFTFNDRGFKSYRQPEKSLDPMLEVKALMAAEQKAKEAKSQ